jgi:hypothetical protein
LRIQVKAKQGRVWPNCRGIVGRNIVLVLVDFAGRAAGAAWGERSNSVGKQIVAGKLLGVADGPVILIEVRGEERGFPLDCQLTVDWVYSHMDKPITCMVTDGRVTEIG